MFGKCWVVPEYDIKTLSQDHIPPICDYLVLWKNHYLTKSLSKILVQSLICSFKSNISLSRKTARIFIVFCGDHGGGKFRCLCKFIIRDKFEINIKDYIYKHCTYRLWKETYEVYQSS